MKFEISRARNGQFFWRIVAHNGQVLAHSETYTTKASCRNAIDTVKARAASAQVVDLVGVR